MSEILNEIRQYSMYKTAAKNSVLVDPDGNSVAADPYIKRLANSIRAAIKAAPGKAWKKVKAAPGKAWSGIKEAPGKAWKGIKAAPGAAWANKGKIGLGALAGMGLGAAGEHLRSNRD